MDPGFSLKRNGEIPLTKIHTPLLYSKNIGPFEGLEV